MLVDYGHPPIQSHSRIPIHTSATRPVLFFSWPGSRSPRSSSGTEVSGCNSRQKGGERQRSAGVSHSFVFTFTPPGLIRIVLFSRALHINSYLITTASSFLRILFQCPFLSQSLSWHLHSANYSILFCTEFCDLHNVHPIQSPLDTTLQSPIRDFGNRPIGDCFWF